MPKKLKYLLIILICATAKFAVAQQYNPNNPNRYDPNNPNQQGNRYGRDTVTRPGKQLTGDELMDTLRKREQHAGDTVIFNSKFIRVTSEALLRDSTQLFGLDTTLTNFENYSPLFQPRSPKISLGSTQGLATRPLLFEPTKTIGFDVGLHALDPYLLTQNNIQYYKARVPVTFLSLVTAGSAEQVFKILHTQNVNPQLNIGFNLNFTGSRGFYSSNHILGQNVSDLNAAFFA
ncbi:MAG: putative porin [Bacteroidota bacterium]